ncbi:PREDICTED: interleukin-15 receptor subunit alpha [Cercocebus atys]|uniref:interleukin-15 receptor subunit alpha n=1 Tax=Cercocebus atys TaxID=9531 RepID=UPI0005F4AB89|nr:PREDICTED: interleukin-15 receptor subunit alpha [Cercocebus atys]
MVAWKNLRKRGAELKHCGSSPPSPHSAPSPNMRHFLGEQSCSRNSAKWQSWDPSGRRAPREPAGGGACAPPGPECTRQVPAAPHRGDTTAGTHTGRQLRTERRAPEGDQEICSLSPQWGHQTECTLEVPEHEERGGLGGSRACVGDPLLARQRPAPPFTVTTAGVTPQPESLSPSGKEPAASSPSSNTTAATTAAIVPSSRLTPSTSPSTGTTEIGSHESSHGPSQTTAKTWELTASASHQPPGVYPQGHSDTTVAISASTVLLCGLSAVSLLACYIKSRQTPPPASIEMEAMEALPVTGETSSRDEDLENCSHDL